MRSVAAMVFPLVVAAVLLLPAGASAGSTVRGCANTYGGDVIQATNMSCRHARRIVRVWARAYKADGRANRRVRGFRCRVRPDRYEGQIGRCRRGSRAVRFYPNVP